MKTLSFDPATLVYDSRGLIPVIAQDVDSNAVLMLAWMNAEAVRRTLTSGRVTYWSRSRQAFWVKGQTSGHSQALVELRHDCDSDALLALVRQTGPACHTGAYSCFFTSIERAAPHMPEQLPDPDAENPTGGGHAASSARRQIGNGSG